MTTKNRADEDVISDMINQKLDVDSDRIAALMGPSPGTENVSGKQELDLWNERDDTVDIWAEYRQALLDGANDLDAKSIATVKAYTNRGIMVLNSSYDDEERKKYAARMKRLSEKQAMEQPVEPEAIDVPRPY